MCKGIWVGGDIWFRKAFFLLRATDAQSLSSCTFIGTGNLQCHEKSKYKNLNSKCHKKLMITYCQYFFNFNELVILFLKITGKYKTYQRNLSKLSCQKTMMLLVNMKIRCFLE